MHLYGKKYLTILFSKTEDALWLNLCIYYWEHLPVCSGYVTQVSEQWPVGLLFNNTLNPEPDAAGRILNNTQNTEPDAE